MCKYIYTNLMRVGKGTGKTGLCLTWNDKCTKCNKPFNITEMYRATKLKAKGTLDPNRGCAQVQEATCIVCEPMNDDEKKKLVVDWCLEGIVEPATS